MPKIKILVYTYLKESLESKTALQYAKEILMESNIYFELLFT